jgi:trehalose 6-phosphate synthase
MWWWRSECNPISTERSISTIPGLSQSTRIGVGVERFDYTRGIVDHLRAIDSRYLEWIGRFVFCQVAAPTRAKLPALSRFTG